MSVCTEKWDGRSSLFYVLHDGKGESQQTSSEGNKTRMLDLINVRE